MDAILDAAKRKAEQTYDAAADCFDAAPLTFWRTTGRKTVELLNLAPGARVLDVGCGSGASALPAAKAVGPSGHVTGLDLSDNLLALARRKAADLGLSHTDFRRVDMTASGYPNDSFDAVISVFSIFFVPDMKRLTAELWRMVKPGGVLAITTWGPNIFEPLYSRWNEAVRREREDLYAAFNPWDRITTPAAVEALFTDAGVPGDTVAVAADDARQPISGPDDWWTIVLGSGLRWTADQLSTDAAKRVRAVNEDWITQNAIESVEVNALYARAVKPKTGQTSQRNRTRSSGSSNAPGQA